MNCPKCIGRLQEHIIDEKYPVQVCFVCHGIWFDKDEIECVIKDGNAQLSDDIDLDPDFAVPEDIKDMLKSFSDKVAQCPKCQGVAMKKEKHYGVMLDACPHCGGVWLDGGEILAVRHHEWKDFLRNARSFLELAKQSMFKRNKPQ
jgi:Zn-finger nucleic acid-binding protein